MRVFVTARRLPACVLFATLLVGLLLAVRSSAAQAAFGVEEANFEAGTCKIEKCTYASPKSDAYTQAAGHPDFGITAFKFNAKKEVGGEAPEGAVKNIRVDIAPGLAANPEAVPKCAIKDFEEDKCAANTQVGVNYLTVYEGINLTIPAAVYNLVQPEGLPLDFGIHVFVPMLANEHIFLEGHVAWESDYHEYFEIHNVSNAIPLLKSELVFKGNGAGSGFLTLPSKCSSTTVSHLRVESYAGEVSETATHTQVAGGVPVGPENCGAVPFGPTIAVEPETTQSDLPDGVEVKLAVPQATKAEELNSSDLADATVTLPEGLTINPAAANGLSFCTSAQIAIGSTAPVTCPAASKIGTVAIESPDLPSSEPLTGNVYLGNSTATDSITGPPYTIYLDAESPRYGQSVRLKGVVSPDLLTGRLTTRFAENPQLPFTTLTLKFTSGPRAPLANPLSCGLAKTETSLLPYTETGAATPFSAFTVDGDGKGGACASPLPFLLTQSAGPSSTRAGAFTNYSFGLGRGDGQEYLSKVRTVLPPGLVGLIPSLTQCGEPQAREGTCPAGSEIGTVAVTAGAGSEPYAFTGKAFLTGPVEGAPYGMSIAVPAVAGPGATVPAGSTPTVNLGTIVTRARIDIDPNTARVIVTTIDLPTIVGGIPLRLRSLNVTVNRANFLINPTNCGALATDTTLTSTLQSTQNVSSSFQLDTCSALPFTPKLTGASSAKTSKANGASLTVKIAQGANQANLHSVVVKLPKQLPSRLTTLQKACPEATFAANPESCPEGSRVGSATAVTPVLPDKLTGTAFIVSHGGAAFPDLDLVLVGNGVKVILVGNTNITGAVTTSTFASIPDVPISSFSLSLPVGPHSALTSAGSLCTSSLIMPTVITAQNGTTIKQNTKLAVAGCGPKVLKRKVNGHTARITVQAFEAGRLSGSGAHLRRVTRQVSKAGKYILKVSLSSAGVRSLRRHGHLKVKVRVGFVPSKKSPSSKVFTTVTFR